MGRCSQASLHYRNWLDPLLGVESLRIRNRLTCTWSDREVRQGCCFLGSRYGQGLRANLRATVSCDSPGSPRKRMSSRILSIYLIFLCSQHIWPLSTAVSTPLPEHTHLCIVLSATTPWISIDLRFQCTACYSGSHISS